jgi:hypothetical protein
MQNKKNPSPATGRRVPAQGAAARTNKPSVVKIDVLRNTKYGYKTIAKYSCEYLDLPGLFTSINGFFGTGEYYPELPDALRINFDSRSCFYWSFNLAHYCFDHGRIEIEDLIEYVLDIPKDLSSGRAAG